MAYPISSPGVNSNEPCDALRSITTNGLGLVNPEKVFSFYNELHSYLASAGIDGVKVDVQNILETIGAGHGGRVKLAQKHLVYESQHRWFVQIRCSPTLIDPFTNWLSRHV